MFVFDFVLILFRITGWPSVGKELSPCLPLVLFLFYAVSVVCVPFPLGVWAGCGIRLYRFLIIAFLSTSTSILASDYGDTKTVPKSYMPKQISLLRENRKSIPNFFNGKNFSKM